MHEKNVELSRLRVEVDTKIKINSGISCLVGDVGMLPMSTLAVIKKPDQKLWRKVLYFLVVTIMVVILCARRVTTQYTPHGRLVHLDTVKALFFYKHRDTTYRRSSPIPQIRCLQGCEYEPEMVRCLNIKGHGQQPRWRCEADLPRHLRFGETAIICEGFDSEHDDHILEGSCGLEYSLLQEPKGRLPWLTAVLSDWRVIVQLALLLLGLGYFIYRRYHPRATYMAASVSMMVLSFRRG